MVNYGVNRLDNQISNNYNPTMPRPIADSRCPLLSFRIKPEQQKALENIWERAKGNQGARTKPEFYRLILDNFIERNSNQEDKS
jgi:hypothetical protein